MPPKIEVGWLPRTSGEDTTVAGTERGRALLGRLDTEEEEERPHGIGRGLAARVTEAASAGGLGRGSAGAVGPAQPSSTSASASRIPARLTRSTSRPA